MVTFTQYCKEYIAEHIDYYKGQSVYLCDLGSHITMDANMNGSLTYSAEEAREFLNAWSGDAADYWKWEKWMLGENLHNPFDNPEEYMVCMVIAGVDYLIDQTIANIGMAELWNEQVKLTSKIVRKIRDNVYNCDDIKLV